VTLEEAVNRWGYGIVLLWTFLEGETVLLMAGFAAHRGWLRLDGVVAAAFAGSLAGDQILFHVGRRWGRRFLETRPRWKSRVDRVHALLERWRDLYVVGFRFLYGLRTVSPLVIGTGEIRSSRFLGLNALGAALWASTFGIAGYLCGSALQSAVAEVKRYELTVLGAMAATGLALWLRRRLRAR
jgi:membrane protein DedA with SNARE-associated domain